MKWPHGIWYQPVDDDQKKMIDPIIVIDIGIIDWWNRSMLTLLKSTNSIIDIIRNQWQYWQGIIIV